MNPTILEAPDESAAADCSPIRRGGLPPPAPIDQVETADAELPTIGGEIGASESNAAARGLRTDSLAASVAILLVLSIVQRLIGFARQILVCRWLEPNQLGEWDICFKFLMLGAPLAVMGLPGSFGRYLEYYRRRGHLKTFLRRTAAVCTILACLATIAIGALRHWVSELVFATPDQTEMVLLLAVCLIALAAYNFLTDMLTALRMVRVTSIVQFASGLLFAVFSIALLLGWRQNAAAIVVAYAGSCAVALVVTLVWLRGTWRSIADSAEPLPHRQLWSKLVPFAAWLWSVNLLYNLVGVVDRYMMMHFAPTSDPLTLVGHYHSSQVVPMLMVSMCGLIGGIIMPHLSHDWETGRTTDVATKLNLTIKLLGLAMLAGSVATLFGAPLLFGVAFHGKYEGGFEILPWTLIYCVWMALIPLAQMYLWCAERPTLASLALAGSLVVNVALCFFLLPRFGLHGVVWATAAANLFALACIYRFNQWLGLRLDAGVWLITLLPLALAAGPWFSLATLVAVAIGVFLTDRVLNYSEKQLLTAVWRERASARRAGGCIAADSDRIGEKRCR
ncbi:MAG TPA: lipopolysaccharide biosynthesis protein [Pirellulales bacterium]|nr:lipopolysaccharide biosynthesis protein [Pirellulales bacterium]